MTTQADIDYALMAGAAYISTRDPVNQLPTPSGWVGMNYDNPIGGGGFEAITFVRTGTTLTTSNEIVISFAGTDPDDLDGDIAADLSYDLHRRAA